MNLGVAVPGKFPAEFSLSFSGYLNLVGHMIGEMNSNVIRYLYHYWPPGIFHKGPCLYYKFTKHLKTGPFGHLVGQGNFGATIPLAGIGKFTTLPEY